MATRVETNTPPVDTALIHGTTPPTKPAIKVVASKLNNGVTAVVKFFPADPKKGTPPKFSVNNKMFTITHISFRDTPLVDWRDIDITKLSESELNELAEACANLFAKIKPTEDKLDKLEFMFTKARNQESFRSKENPTRFWHKQLEPKPLLLKEISTTKEGAKTSVKHTVELGEYDEEGQKVLMGHLEKAQKAAAHIASLPATKKTIKSLASASKETVQKEIEAIRKEFNAYLDAAPAARNSDKLNAAIAAFKTKHKSQDCPEEYKEIKGIEDLIHQITTENRAFAIFDMTGKEIKKTTADGNCFFDAISKGYPFENPQTPADIRTEVVKAMRESLAKDQDPNYPELKARIDASIEAQVAANKQAIENEIASLEVIGGKELEITQLRQQIQELEASKNADDRYTKYIDNMSKPGTFASEAEIYTISQLCDVNIEIVRKVGERFINADPDFKAPSDRRSTITLLHINGNHFDLIVPKVI